MKICNVQEMRQLDQSAVSEFKIPELLLMENAGLGACRVIDEHVGIADQFFVIVCGPGNNGGDGLVVARKLHSDGADVVIYILGDPEKYKGVALQNYQIAQRLPVKIKPFQDLQKIEEFEDDLLTADCVVDAILGTGIDRPVSDQYSQIIDLINEYAQVVVSVDIPSGINGNTGQVMGNAIIADYTVTFGLPKIGNLLFPGFDHGGQLSVTHISFPAGMTTKSDLWVETNDPPELPGRPGDAHKGDCGKVLFIAGSAQYMGAPYFSAMSFLKAGGGLSFLATPQPVAHQIGVKGSELVLMPLKATTGGSIAHSNMESLLDFSKEVDFVVMGPGMSLHDETQQLVIDLALKLEKPLLIDGDGITAVCRHPERLKDRNQVTILTPHLGEMARLTKQEVVDLLGMTIPKLQETTHELNSIIVLKGAHTQIGFPDSRVFINLSGNPGMASAGSGDVLTGTIAAMFGLGLNVQAAVRLGVFVHGLAGDIVAAEIGEDGLLASDIMNHLPHALQLLRDEEVNINANYYHCISII